MTRIPTAPSMPCPPTKAALPKRVNEALEHRRGHAGAMKHLAFFFKDPMETTEFNLFAQWQALLAHVQP